MGEHVSVKSAVFCLKSHDRMNLNVVFRHLKSPEGEKVSWPMNYPLCLMTTRLWSP